MIQIKYLRFVFWSVQCNYTSQLSEIQWSPPWWSKTKQSPARNLAYCNPHPHSTLDISHPSLVLGIFTHQNNIEITQKQRICSPCGMYEITIKHILSHVLYYHPVQTVQYRVTSDNITSTSWVVPPISKLNASFILVSPCIFHITEWRHIYTLEHMSFVAYYLRLPTIRFNEL